MSKHGGVQETIESTYRANEWRFDSLTRKRPDDARRMLAQAQLEKYRIYENLTARDGGRFHPHWEDA